MLTFEEYENMREGYSKKLMELEQMIGYRTAFLKKIHEADDVVDCIPVNGHRYDNDLVIRSLGFLIDNYQLQSRYLGDTLEDPGAAEDIVNSWLDSVNHKYEFKFDGEED